MDEHTKLISEFERERSRLAGVAYRILGSRLEAEDAVQEAWLRLSHADAGAIENLPGWLTTVVARLCLDALRSRNARRETPLDLEADARAATASDAARPDHERALADSIGIALFGVLETLAPAERVAFVLHDVFDMPFGEIAPIVGRTPGAARQLASRARRRVQGAPRQSDADLARHREAVEAFLSASRNGDFEALLALLDADVVLRADRVAVETSAARQAEGAPALAPEMRGAAAVAKTFAGRARAARLARLNGAFGAAWAPGGEPRAAFAFTIAGGRIVAVDIIVDPERLRRLDVQIVR